MQAQATVAVAADDAIGRGPIRQRLSQAGARLAVYCILAVENPDAAAKRWGIFLDGERVYGPENL